MTSLTSEAGGVTKIIILLSWCTYNVVVIDHFLHLCVGVELVHQLEIEIKRLHQHELSKITYIPVLIRCLTSAAQTIKPSKIFQTLCKHKMFCYLLT